jgi:hypothetical protein
MTLTGREPFKLNYADKTLKVYLAKTAKGDFTHVKLALFDMTDNEIVLTPQVLKTETVSGQRVVIGQLDQLQVGNEYFIELAPINDGVQGQPLRTSFQAMADDDNDRIVSVPEYLNSAIRPASAMWHSDECIVTIPGAASKRVQIKLACRKRDGTYQEHLKESRTVMADDTVTVALSDLDGKECILSVRFVDDENNPLSGWKTFTQTKNGN